MYIKALCRLLLSNPNPTKSGDKRPFRNLDAFYTSKSSSATLICLDFHWLCHMATYIAWLSCKTANILRLSQEMNLYFLQTLFPNQIWLYQVRLHLENPANPQRTCWWDNTSYHNNVKVGNGSSCKFPPISIFQDRSTNGASSLKIQIASISKSQISFNRKKSLWIYCNACFFCTISSCQVSQSPVKAQNCRYGWIRLHTVTFFSNEICEKRIVQWYHEDEVRQPLLCSTN